MGRGVEHERGVGRVGDTHRIELRTEREPLFEAQCSVM